ncbi:MAG: murein biosynthesis integral membrane protein MurJ [Woeseia sp.]|nr:murein biosynthesis integral membrane protein MurJ [Woeseia sp.]|tara:strand:+ start:1954 stop:3582 length:1629 start_codon:yes stop_codon:yes gene_type:complete
MVSKNKEIKNKNERYVNNKDSIVDAKLIRKTSVVSGMTLISRVLGLLRDVVFARYFGAKIVMDAFLVANRIPNMLRRFFAEGAFSAGFVSVMARYRENHNHDEARVFVDSITGTFAFVLFVVTLIGVIAAPLLVLIVAPGFVSDGGDFDLAALMLRFTFPYLFFISLTALAGGILNTYGNFGPPAFTPVILNIVLIAAAILISPKLDDPVMALAYGVFIAGFLQLLFQLPFLSKIRLLPIPRWAPHHEGVRRAFKLMVPALFGSSAAKINVLIGGIIASMLPVGSISYLYFSDRLMEFPLGIFSIALGTVTLPYLARLWAKNDKQVFTQTLDWSLKLAFLIIIPAAIGLFILAEPLVSSLFFGGVFDEYAVRMTALALKAYSIGLVGFSFVKILAPAYFAREDTKTPVRIAILSLVINLILSICFAWYMTVNQIDGPHVGLAMATSIAAIFNSALLYFGLLKSEILKHSNGWTIFLIRVTISCIVMIVVLNYFDKPLDWWTGATFSKRIFWLLLSVTTGAVTYFFTMLLLGTKFIEFKLRKE